MRWWAVVAAAAALGAAGCGGKAATPPSATGPVPVSPPPVALTVFRVRSGILHPVVVHVPRTTEVAATALGALDVAVPVTISRGTATVRLARASDVLAAEIVYTLTQFSTIRRVDVAGRKGLTRADFESYTPPIFVVAPAAGATVRRSFRVTGTASVFEATLVVEAVRAGKVLERRTVTASQGAPARGAFATTLHATPGLLTVRAFAPSAKDGSPQHEVDVPVAVRP